MYSVYINFVKVYIIIKYLTRSLMILTGSFNFFNATLNFIEIEMIKKK